MVERFSALLEAEGKSIHDVESPRQSLESLFLEIVEEARETGAETSGALGGSSTAEFLRAPVERRSEWAPAPEAEEGDGE